MLTFNVLFKIYGEKNNLKLDQCQKASKKAFYKASGKKRNVCDL